MFDSLKAMGAVANLLRDKQRLRDAGQRIKSHAERLRAQGEAGGGAVRVTVSGKMRVLAVDLQPALAAGIAAEDRTRELAGSLIAEATNAALARAMEEMRGEVMREARALGLDDLPIDLGALGSMLT